MKNLLFIFGFLLLSCQKEKKSLSEKRIDRITQIEKGINESVVGYEVLLTDLDCYVMISRDDKIIHEFPVAKSAIKHNGKYVDVSYVGYDGKNGFCRLDIDYHKLKNGLELYSSMF